MKHNVRAPRQDSPRALATRLAAAFAAMLLIAVPLAPSALAQSGPTPRCRRPCDTHGDQPGQCHDVKYTEPSSAVGGNACAVKRRGAGRNRSGRTPAAECNARHGAIAAAKCDGAGRRRTPAGRAHGQRRRTAGGSLALGHVRERRPDREGRHHRACFRLAGDVDGVARQDARIAHRAQRSPPRYPHPQQRRDIRPGA